MFYIYANGKSIYQPMDNSLSLFLPKMTLEMGKAGSLEFKVPPNNKYYDFLPPLTTIVTVELDDVEIFRGRVLTNNRDFNNIRTIYCEGDLAYLVDSVQKAEKYIGKAHDLFRSIIAAHNARMEAAKQFAVGEITVPNKDVILTGRSDDIKDAETGKFDYNQIALNSIADEWQNTLEFIETCLLNYTGGYLRTRHVGNTTYIDLLSDYNSNATQEIEFGKNLLDFSEEFFYEDLFTVLVPLGDNGLTIEAVNNGSDELADAQAVSRYGRIVKTHIFDSVSTPETLLENAQRYLANNVRIPTTVTLKAVDMHLVDPNASPIYVGDKVHVSSLPHGVVDVLTCTKIEYDMEDPSNNIYVFGTPRQSLTERYRKDKAKDASEQSHGGGAYVGADYTGGEYNGEEYIPGEYDPGEYDPGEYSGGGGGGGGGAAQAAVEELKEELKEFFDAWINVDPEAGHIDLGTLHELYENGKTVLKQQCGIDLDASSGNINIENLRTQVDENSNAITNQAARIDLINEETGSRIDLVASWAGSIENTEAGHYSELTLRADEHESSISAKADKVKVDSVETELNAVKSTVDNTNNILTSQCGISLNGETGNVNISSLSSKVNEHGTLISENAAAITALSNDTEAKISATAKQQDTQGEKIAKLEIKADKNESSIKIKADKSYVETNLLTISGKLEADEAEISDLKVGLAEVEELIAKKISAITFESLIDKATFIKASCSIESGSSISAPIIMASNSLSVGGKAVATKDFVATELADYATQSWVEDQGYLTKLPNYIMVPTLYATSNMYYGGYTVATQRWCTDTQGFATKEWVEEQLENYAKADHKHAWSTITGKPSSFTPSSHTHPIYLSLANGHTHKITVNGTTYTSTGVSTNATHVIDTSTGTN